jgi:uncharacterized paraquat-inducible protein A
MSDIEFNCPKCNQHLEAPQDLAGVDIECPACETLLSVPAQQGPLTAAQIVGAAAAEEGAEDPESSPHKPFVRADDRKVQCPSCDTSLESGTVICVDCGYNFKTRRKMSAAPDEATVARSGGGDSENKGEKIKIIALVSAILLALAFVVFRMAAN